MLAWTVGIVLLCSSQSFRVESSTRRMRPPPLYVRMQSSTGATTDTITARSKIAEGISTISFERIIREGVEEAMPYIEGTSKQNLLYLPGIDGVGNYSASAFENLTDTYNCWRMVIDGTDRSTFIDIAKLVMDKVDSFENNVVLVGESFGGLLTSYIAARLGKGIVSKIVLVNPATSYDQTSWPIVGPLIASTGPAFPFVGIATLLATAVQGDQFVRIGQKIADRINSTESAIQELNELAASSSLITDLLPPATLNWRLKEWLLLGNFLMEGKYEAITASTLIVTGTGDRLLPSRDEGRRLKDILSKRVVPAGGAPAVELREFDSGHAILDDSFDLAKVMKSSKIFSEDFVALRKQESGITASSNAYEVPLPTEDDLNEIDQQLGQFFNTLSPVFLSRRKDGSVTRGLRPVPTGIEGRPVLLVGNHQLYGADLGMIIRQFLREKDTLVRGLAHPAIFRDGMIENANATSSASRSSLSNGDSPSGLLETFEKFGAVEVSPMAFFNLLKINATVLLFPGGAREAYHGKGEQYKLFWPEEIDFVRMAGMMDALIVPFGAVGIADSVNMVLDSEDILSLPYFGQKAREFNARIPQARIGGNQTFTSPLSLPQLPSRNYFLFQEPFDTRQLDIYNKTQCKSAYGEVRDRVQDSLDTLLQFREKDPYKDYIPRTIYERATGQQAPIPSMHMNLLRPKKGRHD